MSQSIALLTLTVEAAAVLVADRFVLGDGTQAGAAANPLGVVTTTGAAGDLVAVDIIGTAVVEAGAAVALDALLETDADGRAVTQSAGPTVGRALGAASAAGQKIEVLLIHV